MPSAEPEAGGPGANPFWDYSLARYARPGIAEACIGLQDRLGADVNLLLFCCWAGHRGHRLSAGELDALMAAVGDWQAETVAPLRALRRRLKPQTGRASEVEALYEELKAAELAAERIAQQHLQACLPLAAGGPSARALADNLALYLARLAAKPGAVDEAALAALRAAAL